MRISRLKRRVRYLGKCVIRRSINFMDVWHPEHWNLLPLCSSNCLKCLLTTFLRVVGLSSSGSSKFIPYISCNVLIYYAYIDFKFPVPNRNYALIFTILDKFTNYVLWASLSTSSSYSDATPTNSSSTSHSSPVIMLAYPFLVIISLKSGDFSHFLKQISKASSLVIWLFNYI